MTQHQIRLTVLTTMAENSHSPTDREHLMAKVDNAQYDELMRFERHKQVLLMLILFVLAGLFLVTAIAPLAPAIARMSVWTHPTPMSPPVDHKTWWTLPGNPAIAPRHSS